MMSKFITAIEIARQTGIDPKRFRQALRDAGLPWHNQYSRWTVPANGREESDMLRVAERLTGGSADSQQDQSEQLGQRDLMRMLFAISPDEDWLCGAYALADELDLVRRDRNEYRLSAYEYAKRLYADAIAKGWLSA